MQEAKIVLGPISKLRERERREKRRERTGLMPDGGLTLPLPPSDNESPIKERRDLPACLPACVEVLGTTVRNNQASMAVASLSFARASSSSVEAENACGKGGKSQ